MKDSNEIRSRLLLINPDAATIEAFDRAIESESMMKDGTCPVLDANQNPLVVGDKYFGNNYFPIPTDDRRIILKIRCWAFIYGNKLDRYYQVFYTDDLLKDCFLIINARYPNGIFKRAVYMSELVPLSVR